MTTMPDDRQARERLLEWVRAERDLGLRESVPKAALLALEAAAEIAADADSDGLTPVEFTIRSLAEEVRRAAK